MTESERRWIEWLEATRRQGRITVEDVRRAYAEVGADQVRHGWGELEHVEDDQERLSCACPLTVVAEHRTPGTVRQVIRAYQWEYNVTTEEVAAIAAAGAKVSGEYALGFLWGVDGYEPEKHWLTTAQALIGFADGRAVAQDLFDDERRERIP